MTKKHDLDTSQRPEVWLGAPDGGRPFSVRAIDLGDGRVAVLPTRLFIRVFADIDLGDEHGDGRRGDIEMKSALNKRFTEVPKQGMNAGRPYTGRQVVIDADTTEEGQIEIRAVTITRADGPVTATDLTKGIRIQEWAEDGLVQATSTLSATRGAPDDLAGAAVWGHGREVGEAIAERVKQRPPVGSGRRKPMAAVELAGKLYAEGHTFGRIRLLIKDHLGMDRSERTIRRWIEDMRKQDH